uniref:Uncharacterized protein n=1 Tax=Timspurckia oligopyrenoides TaxID=708627 RepID=A0A7S0ZAJ9_9RHOD|mmetsp:Transcript_10288/g.18536  ORF Transcript_10288/g.18536 Transcript_10288/m.18536 type:complete len:128 (+) Transcript_10288:199-582(+)
MDVKCGNCGLRAASALDSEFGGFCGSDCYWSVELGGGVESRIASQTSRSSSTPSLGVNPLASTMSESRSRLNAANLNDGILLRRNGEPLLSQTETSLSSASHTENAMFLFHGYLSSTFRPDFVSHRR